ncbi:ECF transporter S component [Olsenella uli]|uniref:ECF transporter S component n=1 Tax=Olsenella uli TaxID=133926 RepID=UPI0012AB7361|nr:ECF transporter S component [Olsenella uli]
MNPVKKVVVTAVCAALGVVLPMLFHAIPNAGMVWLPMHVPVLVCGLLVGPVPGLVAGILAPALSSALTGMPPAPMLPSMVCELAVYGLVAGLLSQYVRTGKAVADLYVSLVGSMLVGRIVGGVLQALIFSAGSYSIAAWGAAYFAMGLPGIILQLVVIVPIVSALEHAGLVPARYSGK